MAGVREPAIRGDLGQRQVTGGQQGLSGLDATLQEPAVRGPAGGVAERPGEVTGGEAAGLRDLQQRHAAGEVGVDELLCAALLPRCEVALARPSVHRRPAVCAHQMGVERERDVVQKQLVAGAAALDKRRGGRREMIEDRIARAVIRTPDPFGPRLVRDLCQFVQSGLADVEADEVDVRVEPGDRRRLQMSHQQAPPLHRRDAGLAAVQPELDVGVLAEHDVHDIGVFGSGRLRLVGGPEGAAEATERQRR